MSRINFQPTIQGMFDLYSDQYFIPGYSGGIVFLYFSEPNKGLQMEINYSQKGWTEYLDSANSYNRKLDYIEFPFLSHFDIGLRKLKLSVTIGPTISYQILSREEINITDENLFKQYYTTAADNKLEVGLSIGLGVNRMTKLGIIQLECRLNQGLNNIFSREVNKDISTSQNQVIGVNASYLFGW